MLARLRRRLSDERGVTLAETMIVLLILSITLGAAFAALTSFQRQAVGSDVRAQNLAEARQMMATITRDLRTATKPARASGVTQPPGFISAGARAVAFYANLDTPANGGPRRITLEVDGSGVLWERSVAPTGTYPSFTYTSTPTSRRLGQFVVNTDAAPLFEYLDGNDVVLGPLPLTAAQLDRVAMVRVNLRVLRDSGLTVPATTLRTTVRMPNLAYDPTGGS